MDAQQKWPYKLIWFDVVIKYKKRGENLVANISLEEMRKMNINYEKSEQFLFHSKLGRGNQMGDTIQPIFTTSSSIGQRWWGCWSLKDSRWNFNLERKIYLAIDSSFCGDIIGQFHNSTYKLEDLKSNSLDFYWKGMKR
jgi:hypothetical protein